MPTMRAPSAFSPDASMALPPSGYLMYSQNIPLGAGRPKISTPRARLVAQRDVPGSKLLRSGMG